MTALSMPWRLAIGSCVVLLLSAVCLPARAADTRAAAACSLSSEGLRTLDSKIAANASNDVYPGAVYMISRHGKRVHAEAVGLSNVDSKRPMREDTIFRLASMSKPITAAAIMMLVDDGKIRLDDPISRYIPEFARMRVGPYAPGKPEAELAALPYAAHPITIWNLLTHTSGMEADIAVDKELTTKLSQRTTLAAWMPYYAHFPLAWQPGARFSYSALMGFDVLGRIVEVVSGQPYDKFLSKRMFGPLGMKDTTFRLSDEQATRLVAIYAASDGKLTPAEASFASDTYFSGAGGLFGTAPDYLKFADMLAGHGAGGGVRILSRKSVDLMGSMQLPPTFPGLGPGNGWGLGMRHATAGAIIPPGSYGWSGAFGTHFWVDPRHQLEAVFMINLSNAQGAAAPTSREYERLVYGAFPPDCSDAE